MERDALEYLESAVHGFWDVAPSGDETSRLLAVPRGTEIESLERFQGAPNRIEKSVNMLSCESFCEYINRFKNLESSVYLNVVNGSFKAVLDHYGLDEPSWCKHSANFAPQRSLPWQAWKSIHKKKLNQIQLAEFIEENLDSISDPEPNVMLKAALDFQHSESMVFESKKNLDDGSSQLTFEKNNAIKNIVFPHRVSLHMPIHENESKHIYHGRVRFHVNGDGALMFTFSFIEDPEAIERNALTKIANNIVKETDGLSQYHGTF